MFCNCLFVFGLFIYFLAKGDQSQKFGVKLKECFIVQDQSFKKRVAKI